MPQNRPHADVCLHGHGPRLTNAALASIIKKAKVRCEDIGLRWTTQRERTLVMLLEAGGPVKAYDLLNDFKAGAATAPPTIYRALDALVVAGLAHRIPSINAYVACHLGNDGHIASFLICDCCGAVEEVATPTDAISASITSQSAFKAKSLTIEAHGHCTRCQS